MRMQICDIMSVCIAKGRASLTSKCPAIAGWERVSANLRVRMIVRSTDIEKSLISRCIAKGRASLTTGTNMTAKQMKAIEEGKERL